MLLELDHIFVCCSVGAPEAEAVRRLGIHEIAPVIHVGRGAAVRRFSFSNARLDLLWIDDEGLARASDARRTCLWDRWSGRMNGACPIGLFFRPGRVNTPAPFATWRYSPPYLSGGPVIEFAQGLSLAEPELAYLPSAPDASSLPGKPIRKEAPLGRLLGVTVTLPAGLPLSLPLRAARSAGMVNFVRGDSYLLELNFSSETVQAFDLRPALPAVIRGIRH